MCVCVLGVLMFLCLCLWISRITLTQWLKHWCWGLSVIVSCRYSAGLVPDFLFFKWQASPRTRLESWPGKIRRAGQRAAVRVHSVLTGVEPIATGEKAPSKAGKILFANLQGAKDSMKFQRIFNLDFLDFFTAATDIQVNNHVHVRVPTFSRGTIRAVFVQYWYSRASWTPVGQHYRSVSLYTILSVFQQPVNTAKYRLVCYYGLGRRSEQSEHCATRPQEFLML